MRTSTLYFSCIWFKCYKQLCCCHYHYLPKEIEMCSFHFGMHQNSSQYTLYLQLVFSSLACVFCGKGAHLCMCLEPCSVEQEATIEDNDIDGYICFIESLKLFFFMTECHLKCRIHLQGFFSSVLEVVTQTMPHGQNHRHRHGGHYHGID